MSTPSARDRERIELLRGLSRNEREKLLHLVCDNVIPDDRLTVVWEREGVRLLEYLTCHMSPMALAEAIDFIRVHFPSPKGADARPT